MKWLKENASRVKQIVLSLANRGGGMILQFASLWVFAKVIGVTGIGQYAFYTSWMTVLAALSGFGTASHSLRTVSVYKLQNKNNAIRKYVRHTSVFLTLSGLLLLGLLAITAEALDQWSLNHTSWTSSLIMASIGSIAFMLMRLMTETLKGLNKPNLAITLETILIPALLISFCGSAFLFQFELSSTHLIIAHIIVTLIATATIYVAIYRETRDNTTNCVDDESKQSSEFKLFGSDILSLWGTSLAGMLFLNLPIMLLPWFATEEEMGQFAIAYRYVNICITLLMVIASIYGPKFAREYAARDAGGLKSSLKQTQLISLILYAPLFLIFVFLPHHAMGLFGSEFSNGAPYLIAMALGQMLYASTGLVGMMMNMIHKANIEFFISLSFTIFMAMMIFTMGHIYSVMGVSIAFGLVLGLKNVASWFASRHFLNKLHHQSINNY